MLIWLIGLICSIWCVLDILKKDITLVGKIVVAVIVLLTSWIGLAVYYFWARVIILPSGSSNFFSILGGSFCTSLVGRSVTYA